MLIDIITMKLSEKVKECEELSILSNKEAVIENGLIAMKEQWNNYPINLFKNSDNVILLF